MSQSPSTTLPTRTAPAFPVAAGALLLATGAWGSLFFVGQSVLRDVDPLWFTTIRYLLATLLLLALRPLFGSAGLGRALRDAPRLAGYGLAGYGLFSVLVFVGVKLSVPSHGAVIMATIPVTTVLVRWLRDGVRPAGRSLAASALALAGVACVAGLAGGGAAADGRALAGDLLTLAGTFGWITYTRGAARFPDLSPFDYTAFTALASAPLLLAAAVLATMAGVVHWPEAPALLRHGPAFAYVAILPTVTAVVAFNFGVRTLGQATGTLFIN